MPESVTTHDVMSAATWRTARHALAVALARHAITQQEYDSAMTEVMGTRDKAWW